MLLRLAFGPSFLGSSLLPTGEPTNLMNRDEARISILRERVSANGMQNLERGFHISRETLPAAPTVIILDGV
jgi:hypothetical protein